MIVQPGRRDLLDVAAEVLTHDPTASLGDVAAAAGIGRTTLHARYPKRIDLLLAIGHDSVRRVADAIAAASLPGQSAGAAEYPAALRRLTEALVPIGARTHFLLRQPSLDADPDLAAAIAAGDEPLEDFIRRAQHAGAIDPGAAPWWVLSLLFAVTYSAWEGVAAGRLAAVDAPHLAHDALVRGIGAG